VGDGVGGAGGDGGDVAALRKKFRLLCEAVAGLWGGCGGAVEDGRAGQVLADRCGAVW
jgi:hypothetical protein